MTRRETHLQALAVNEHLFNKLRLHINILDFLRHDVLALAQLEDMLFAINNLKRPVRVPSTNVACVMPALRVDRLGCSLRIFEVSLEHARTFDADFSLLVVRVIFHLRHINHLERVEVEIRERNFQSFLSL